MKIGRLCVITDTSTQSRFSHEQLASMAIEGGADMIQLRDKHLTEIELIENARCVQRVCVDHGVTFIVNDRVDIALEIGADGVHVGSMDTPVQKARSLLGESAIVGGSAGTLADALAVEAAGANYLGFGHIFPTSSKNKPTPPVGLDTLKEVCASMTIPVIAIGGIDETNAASVINAGAWGVAVIASVCAAPDPRQAARRIRDLLPA